MPSITLPQFEVLLGIGMVAYIVLSTLYLAVFNRKKLTSTRLWLALILLVVGLVLTISNLASLKDLWQYLLDPSRY